MSKRDKPLKVGLGVNGKAAHVQQKPMSYWADVWFRLRKNKAAMVSLVVILIVILAAIFADVIADYETMVIQPDPHNRMARPSLDNLLGTDQLGRDMLARILHGTRYSLSFGLAGATLSLIGGVILGAAAAFFGGKVDNVITFIVDAIICIPGMLLALSLVTVMGPGLRNLMIALVISGIPGFTRVVRSIVLGIVREEYIEAAHAIGVSNPRIIAIHVLPNAISLLIVNMMMSVSGLIMAAAGMSFIGMGIQPPAPEWGSMLNASMIHLRTNPHTVIFPGLAIVITALSFNLLGDGLSDAFDPRLKE